MFYFSFDVLSTFLPADCRTEIDRIGGVEKPYSKYSDLSFEEIYDLDKIRVTKESSGTRVQYTVQHRGIRYKMKTRCYSVVIVYLFLSIGPVLTMLGNLLATQI